MNYYIYGEVVLIENFLINFIILMITAKILRKRIKWLRIIPGALLGAIYSIMQFKYIIFTHFSFKIALSVFIIIITFYPINIKQFTNYMLLFYSISLLFGGCVIAIIILSNHSSNMTLNINGVKSSTITIGVFIGILVVIKARELMIDIKLRKTNILDIRIGLNSQTLYTKGFTDTGCHVTDPLNGKPILLVEYEAIKEILPLRLKNYYYTYDDKLDYDIDKKIMEIEILKKIRFVPFHTVNKDINSYMLCYQCDYIELYDNENTLRIDKSYIGICKTRLSQHREFQALINPKLLYMNGGF
ncbi:hypothetical protein GC105_05210 [Alkalibaculum sp. M08DMB]|uniref:Sporulation sigma-E factor-processing peptidase n=1 Tax=Alkalibaculum sporogenes TaxID=2655001 RepID=A0A6A7K6U4_9FIRM|nr:sigma-E processing peptidase SpoIIGA [Alkalibaculum sporogenes]MPW25188.1 hypothetical protein [Alkalibaculum sporogenes]